MEIYEIANEIQNKIKLLEIMRKEIKERGENKALAISEYDKKMAITMIKLKNKSITEWNGEEIKATASNEIEKISRGICWKEKFEMENADGLCKSVISNMHCVMSEVNALQSINRYLDKG